MLNFLARTTAQLLSRTAHTVTAATITPQRRQTSAFAQAMSDALQQANAPKDAATLAAAAAEKQKRTGYKPRYDGRAKKRNWVDYGKQGADGNRRTATASDDAEEDAATAEKRANFNPADRIKRKKCAILLGYSGVNYFGMQRNPEMKTIEEDLLAAMLSTGWITEDAFKQAQSIQFQRAARTDKGVSAARQCVSLKLPDDVKVEDINSVLPEQIRVFCVRRVTKGFNAKDKCCGRTYTYTVPTVAFAHHSETIADPVAYRCDPAQVQRLNELLAMFVGTRCFHNFTSRKEFIDPSAKRFIVSFACAEPFVEPQHGIQLAVLKVKGQSFMLHQIRKMVGLTLAVLRGHTEAETITRAFGEKRIDVPMAPGLGLVLDQVHYDRYNERYATDGIHEALSWEREESEIQGFFDTFIRPTIVQTEVRDASMVNWMQTLSLHSYAERVEGRNEPQAEDGVESVSAESSSVGEEVPSVNDTTESNPSTAENVTPVKAAVVDGVTVVANNGELLQEKQI